MGQVFRLSGKPIREKPAKGAIELELESKPKHERARHKALQHAGRTGTFALDGTTVNVLSAVVDSRGVLVVRVHDTWGFPPNAQPFEFVNPPVKVPDGTVRIETDARGNDAEVANMVEDVQAAFQRILVDAIHTVVK